MNKPDRVRFPATMEPITTTTELARVCAHMARHAFVTIDTEFLRETTYYPLLCVAQMASPDDAVLIDALAPDIDLAPFFALLANEQVMKVFHAARQDIEIVWNLAKSIPHPVFDTQVAAMVLGYGDSISYDQLVQRITGDNLDKSHRFTDWTRRPLSDAQIAYALSDVTHLRAVYEKLAADLASQGRANWVEAEMNVLTSPDTYRMDPERAWERLKSRVRKPKELAVLIEVAAWREREAQTRDVPRSRRPPSSGSGRCARYRKDLSARAGAVRSSTRSSAGWHAIPRRCRSSTASARRPRAPPPSNS
jgi:ribonuclease D